MAKIQLPDGSVIDTDFVRKPAPVAPPGNPLPITGPPQPGAGPGPEQAIWDEGRGFTYDASGRPTPMPWRKSTLEMLDPSLRFKAPDTGSIWQKLYAKQEQDQATQAASIPAQIQGASAGARAQIASRGGIGGGGLRSIARESLRGDLRARQALAREGMGQRTELGLKKAMTDVELGTKEQITNIANALTQGREREDALSKRYDIAGKIYGGEKVAEATRSAGGGGKK